MLAVDFEFTAPDNTKWENQFLHTHHVRKGEKAVVAGHLQQKKGHWYIVLDLHDEQGKRKPKWIATHLPVGNNKRKAEELLFRARQRYADGREASGFLFADYMLRWPERVRFQVSPATAGTVTILRICIVPAAPVGSVSTWRR